MAVLIRHGKTLEPGDRIECPMCARKGCEECGHGTIEITETPKIPADIWETLNYAEAFEYHLPLAGGLLDQDRWFMDAALFVRAEHKALEAEAIKNGSR